MPHKFNAARRHKFPKKRYRVTNWAEYTEILRRRGDLTIWVTGRYAETMASAAPDDSGRSAEIFEHCDRDLPDSAYDLQTTAAPDPRADAQHRSADGSRHSGAGFLNTVAPRARLEIAWQSLGSTEPSRSI